MKRKVGKKQSKKMRVPEPSSYFIGSEGTKTEVIYFQGLARKLKEKYKGLEERVVVPSLTIQGMGTSNKRLLLDIEEYLRKDPRIFENIWAVFDKDDVPDDYFDNAISEAEHNGWHVGWANDSFELWYLLHFEYLHAAITRGQYKEKLSNYFRKFGLKKYKKNDPAGLSILLERRDMAIKNASKLEASYSQATPLSKRNPCTTVHHLVQELKILEENAQKK